MGFSRDTFYRYQELAQEGGVEALIDRSKRKSNIKNRVDEAVEKIRSELRYQSACLRTTPHQQ